MLELLAHQDEPTYTHPIQRIIERKLPKMVLEKLERGIISTDYSDGALRQLWNLKLLGTRDQQLKGDDEPHGLQHFDELHQWTSLSRTWNPQQFISSRKILIMKKAQLHVSVDAPAERMLKACKCVIQTKFVDKA
uniref:Uncharacterized protein n=1 Tax=Parascaris univalens TaxID=6257 RepID=A0A915A4R1_PARUN